MTAAAPQIIRTRRELKAALDTVRQSGRRIGFVPTMGALHDGHLSLVEIAASRTDFTVASIFVNPAQFAEGEDLDRYPRDEAGDVAKLGSAGCDLVYCPDVHEMYPTGTLTTVHVAELSDLLDGRFRPHFFYGVTTVVARLFIHVGPDVAVFGEKDYQQLQIIKRMVADLGFAIKIIGGPTHREHDGLARSSRNAYLDALERRRASALFSALHRARARIEAGAPVGDALAEAEAFLEAAGFTKIDYVAATTPDTLADLPNSEAACGVPGRLLGAAWMGTTRLIDNIAFKRP